MEITRVFYWKIFCFWRWNFLYIWSRCVFVMSVIFNWLITGPLCEPKKYFVVLQHLNLKWFIFRRGDSSFWKEKGLFFRKCKFVFQIKMIQSFSGRTGRVLTSTRDVCLEQARLPYPRRHGFCMLGPKWRRKVRQFKGCYLSYFWLSTPVAVDNLKVVFAPETLYEMSWTGPILFSMDCSAL